MQNTIFVGTHILAFHVRAFIPDQRKRGRRSKVRYNIPGNIQGLLTSLEWLSKRGTTLREEVFRLRTE